MKVSRESGKTKLADIMTKLIPTSKKNDICGKFMRRLWNHMKGNVRRTSHTCL